MMLKKALLYKMNKYLSFLAGIISTSTLAAQKKMTTMTYSETQTEKSSSMLKTAKQRAARMNQKTINQHMMMIMLSTRDKLQSRLILQN